MGSRHVQCPKCESIRTFVVSVSYTDMGQTVRRRACRACLHRWYTLQYPETPIDAYQIKWRHGTHRVELAFDNEND